MSIQHDEAMHDKGYRYKLIPLNAEFEPLYSKTLSGIGPLIRENYKDIIFDIKPIRYDWKITDLLHLWKYEKHDEVVKILADEHPGLTALFIAQGVADKIVKRDDLNIIANKLSEYRQAEFQ